MSNSLSVTLRLKTGFNLSVIFQKCLIASKNYASISFVDFSWDEVFTTEYIKEMIIEPHIYTVVKVKNTQLACFTQTYVTLPPPNTHHLIYLKSVPNL